MEPKETNVEPMLDEIRSRHSGILRAEDVVEAARPDDSPLHECFMWDDHEAAKLYRLWQSRLLIINAGRMYQ